MKSVIVSLLMLVSSVTLAHPVSDVIYTAGKFATSQTVLGMGLGYVIQNHKAEPDAYKTVHCSKGGYEFNTTKFDAAQKGLNCK